MVAKLKLVTGELDTKGAKPSYGNLRLTVYNSFVCILSELCSTVSPTCSSVFDLVGLSYKTKDLTWC